MQTFESWRRVGALAVVAGGISLLLAGRVLADAACVGDCNGDGMVTIDELVLGVNIAQGLQPVSACEAFANADGEVTIAQLIKGVNNALDGCPSADLGTHTCELDNGTPPSQLSLFFAAGMGTPLSVPLAGSISLSCGTPDADGATSCICEVGTIDPINLPAIGYICIGKTDEPCPAATLNCNGGAPNGLNLISDGLVGSCTGNEDCAASCDTYCNSLGSVTSASGCTGFCSAGTMEACTSDAACLPDNGACNGPDPVAPARADQCQCSCLNAAVGDNSRPGDFQCNLGSVLNVEKAPPCDGSDITIAIGSTCVALTTGTASTEVTNANFIEGATVPTTGPATAIGAPISCDDFRAGNLTGLNTRGVVNFFGSTIGDIASTLAATCK